MRRFLIALLATAAALPAAATAQDGAARSDDNPRPRFEGRSGNATPRAPRVERARDAAPTPVQRAPRANFQPRTDSAPATAPVVAQREGRNWGGRDRGGRSDGQAWGGRNRGDNPRGGILGAVPAPQAQPAPVAQSPDRRPAWSGNGNDRRRDWNRNDNDRRDWNRNDNDRRDWNRNGDGRGGRWNDNRNGRWNDGNRNFRNWDRNWRGDRRYDWQRYRSSNRHAFRLPRYYAPYGWQYGYRRFSIGATLFAGLFAQDYWIQDPWAYRLPPVYWPYQWVRYYNDALLVDTRSGYVVDSIPDIFWY